MGCAIIIDNIGIKFGSFQEKFNGVMLRMARESKGYELEDLAKNTGIRKDHLVEIEEGLCQPTQYEVSQIMECIVVYLERFYHFETFVKSDMVFVCGKGIQACDNCGQVSDYLCDYPVGDGKTCSLHICKQCRIHIGRYDFCPIHGEVNKVISRLG